MSPRISARARARTHARDALLRHFRDDVRSGQYRPSVDDVAERLATWLLEGSTPGTS